MMFVETHPDYRDLLEEAGLVKPEDFLACKGEPVNLRPHRQVQRLPVAGTTGYLKTDTVTSWRDRWTSWWGGYGGVATSLREGRVLRELASAGIGCPTVLALGQAASCAFLLLKGEDELLPLDEFLQEAPEETDRVVGLLGNELARVHTAGFFHPDLFAKHILIGRRDGLYRFSILDWQRSSRLGEVSWSRRVLDLAMLEAALPEELIPEPQRQTFLRSYLDAATGDRPQLERLQMAIRSRAWLLRRQRRVLRQRRLATPRVHNRHRSHDLPATHENPTSSALPHLNFGRSTADLNLHRRQLAQAGRRLRELHDAGCEVEPATLDLGSLLKLTASRERLVPHAVLPLGVDAPQRLAILNARHGLPLSSTDRLRFLRGYLGDDHDSPAARRELLRRILEVPVREPAP